MNLGKKIFELRKKNNMSQEELGYKLGVTRQTISNWELNETTPSIEQLKKLSNEFNISIDELVNNDINSIVTNKISNTEKLAGLTLKFIKIIFIIMIIFIIFFITLFILGKYPSKISDNDLSKTNVDCSVDGNKYTYEFLYDSDGKIKYAGGDDFFAKFADTEEYDYVDDAINKIEFMVKEKNGICHIDKN